jgi:hypothetical protein
VFGKRRGRFVAVIGATASAKSEVRRRRTLSSQPRVATSELEIQMSVPVIAFAAFLLSFAAMWPLGRDFRRRLIEQHHDIWVDISRDSYSVDSALLLLAAGRRIRHFADPELSRSASRIKWLLLIIIGAWLVLAVGLLLPLLA